VFAICKDCGSHIPSDDVCQSCDPLARKAVVAALGRVRPHPTRPALAFGEAAGLELLHGRQADLVGIERDLRVLGDDAERLGDLDAFVLGPDRADERGEQRHTGRTGRKNRILHRLHPSAVERQSPNGTGFRHRTTFPE
jgi:hypothetical protein